MRSSYSLKKGEKKNVCLVFLHGDELAAGTVACEAYEKNNCGLVKFEGKERLAKFNFNGEAYLFDPNQIWTSGQLKLGEREITNINDSSLYLAFFQAVVHPIRYFVREHKVSIALHNNGNSTLSFRSFCPQGKLAKHARKIIEADPENEGDFFIVTQEKDFLSLAETNQFNVVFQQSLPYNDGSMSVWAARKGWRYFNVEVKRRPCFEEALNKQRQMLEAVLKLTGL